jgi:hypothetical protein
MHRAWMPHPAGQIEHVVKRTDGSPAVGTGIHGQFWVQIAESSRTFQGTGVIRMPAAEPAASFRISLLLIFIVSFSSQSRFHS